MSERELAAQGPLLFGMTGALARHDSDRITGDPLWCALHQEAEAIAREEGILASYLHATVINHATLEGALSYLLAAKLASPDMPAMTLRELISAAFNDDRSAAKAVRLDLAAAVDRDPAAHGVANPFLNHKGFHALQAQRVSHWLWIQSRRPLALYLQSRMSEVFSVDIHPAVPIKSGVFIDHATGVVVGETASIGNNVSMLQGVTLGGTGKEKGDRHPKVADGALISAGATILGNIHIGAGSKVGAGSVVLEDVPAGVTVVGVPARIIARTQGEQPAISME